MDDPSELTMETIAAAYGEEPFRPGSEVGDVSAPIHLSSTFAVPGVDADFSLEDLDPDAGEFVYSRLSNPTRHALETRLAALEGGKHGMAFSSGTSAIFTAILSVVEPGDHLVAGADCYSGTRRMLEEVFDERLDVSVTFVDSRETGAVREAMTDRTSFVWMETPTNPRMDLCDIAAIAEIAAAHDAVYGVDNTFASPCFQRPLELGADLVGHSTTKYLNGHSDSLGGVVITSDDELAESIRFHQQVGIGNVLSPFDSYLVLRGLKTLPGRMRAHAETAGALARFLAAHELVEAVHYPGLESHPQHDLAREQMDGYSGVLSFELAGGIEDAKRFLEALEVCNLAVSLGGVETLIEHPATMTHEPLSPEERAALGISETLIRLSVGLEGLEDLRADLERGLEAVAQSAPVTSDD